MRLAGFKDKGKSQDPRKAGKLEMGEGKGKETLPASGRKAALSTPWELSWTPNSQNSKLINCVVLSYLIC